MNSTFAGIEKADFSPELVVIPSGTFLMGSPDQSLAGAKELFLEHRGTEEEWDGLARGDPDEQPSHVVTIGYRFAVGRYAVTFDEFDRFAESDYAKGQGFKPPNDEGSGRGRRPVINVSWEDAQEYLKWLNSELGLDPGGSNRYRLLTEAEWEYACRAGSRTNCWWGNEEDDARGNFGGSRGGTTEVGACGTSGESPWRLHDMLGNVWEWVEDCYHDSYVGAPTDGSAWVTRDCKHRVLRGSAWSDLPWNVRSANRDRLEPNIRIYDVGVRVACTLPSANP